MQTYLGVAILIRQNRFENKITRDKEGHFTIMSNAKR